MSRNIQKQNPDIIIFKFVFLLFTLLSFSNCHIQTLNSTSAIFSTQNKVTNQTNNNAINITNFSNQSIINEENENENLRHCIYKYSNDSRVFKTRHASHPIHPILLSRFSTRLMTREEPAITTQELMSLFEAARWSPSYYNIQPWRFIYATRNNDSKDDNSSFTDIFNLLKPSNQVWCRNASALIALVSVKYQNHRSKVLPLDFSSFDAGSAWMSMAIEGNARGLAVHAIAGFDKDRAEQVLAIPKLTHQLHVIIAVGRKSRSIRFDENGIAIEEKITQRNEIETFISREKFEARENDIFANLDDRRNG